MARTPLGRFVWHDLYTTDREAAGRFYGDLIGWNAAAAWGNDAHYSLWSTPRGPVGGLAALSANLRASGVPPHWLSYLGTSNVDESVARAKGMGGAVTVGPLDIPGSGRFAVIEDPTGAAVGLYAADPKANVADHPELEAFSWHELATTSPDGAMRFYGALMGWEKMGEVDMGPDGKYELFGQGGAMMGGIYQLRDQQPGPYWLPYAKVASADQSHAAATAAGAKSVVAPMEVPGGDRIAMLIDPQGALFAVHSLKAS